MNEKLSHGSEEWIDDFLSYVFLKEGAIFVLWGSKPLTIIPVYLYTREEILELYNQLTEEEKEQATIVESYGLPSNWKKWGKFQETLNIKRFEFFLRENPKNPKIPEIWFANTLQIALTIEEHYEIFSKILGFDFESHQVVSQIKNPHSLFWNKVIEEPLLLGILHGFGKTNSLCFHWKHVKNSPIENVLDFTFSDTTKIKSTSIKNFPLPIFASFCPEGSIIKKYEEERKIIKTHYKNKNFVDLTLEKLQQ